MEVGPQDFNHYDCAMTLMSYLTDLVTKCQEFAHVCHFFITLIERLGFVSSKHHKSLLDIHVEYSKNLGAAMKVITKHTLL